MSAKFTPGPWLLQSCSHGGAIVVRGKCGQHQQSHIQIVPIEDAWLIAAAPDLYESLKETKGVAAILMNAICNLDTEAFDSIMKQIPKEFEGFGARANAALRKADREPA